MAAVCPILPIVFEKDNLISPGSNLFIRNDSWLSCVFGRISFFFKYLIDSDEITKGFNQSIS